MINSIPSLFDKDCDPLTLGDKAINCLLYADDLILLSKSEKGLQNCLDHLDGHCKEIGMVINISKTKIMVFNKAGRKLNVNFTINEQRLEVGTEYKYLGIVFCPSVSFTKAKENLYKRSLKAYFKLKKAILGINNPKLGKHLFDHTISPIITYCSEVWGSFKSTTINIDQMSLKAIFNHSIIENTQRKFSRYLLGLSKQCSTDALSGELGWKPIYSSIILAVIKYWHRLENTENSLLSNSFKEHQTLKLTNADNIISTVQIMITKLKISLPLTELKHLPSSALNKLLKESIDVAIKTEYIKK